MGLKHTKDTIRFKISADDPEDLKTARLILSMHYHIRDAGKMKHGEEWNIVDILCERKDVTINPFFRRQT